MARKKPDKKPEATKDTTINFYSSNQFASFSIFHIMKHLKFLSAVLTAMLFTTFVSAQSGMVKKSASASATEKTETFQVLGNCGMCQRTIQKAATGAGAVKAFWNEETDMLSVTFDPEKTSVEAIQKAVALAGYDNVGFKAPDEAYKALHACCQYDRTGAPSTAKSCEEKSDSEHK